MITQGILLWLRALRVHHWGKNVLVFLPLLCAHKFSDASALSNGALAFISFCLCASAGYLLNDLFDLKADREHPIKRGRPIASGGISAKAAVAAAVLAALAGLAAGGQLPLQFLLCAALYLGSACLYSALLKRVVPLDIIVLALLYTLRVLAGGYATGAYVSEWLLALSMFFFLSLACLKRFSEIQSLQRREGQADSRGYRASDLEQISQFGSASGYISVLVLGLYVNTERAASLYSHPQIIWLICPLLLYWITRIWLLARRSEIDEDPVLFAMRDPLSYAAGAAVILLVFSAI